MPWKSGLSTKRSRKLTLLGQKYTLFAVDEVHSWHSMSDIWRCLCMIRHVSMWALAMSATPIMTGPMVCSFFRMFVS